MITNSSQILSDILRNEPQILDEWLRRQMSAETRHENSIQQADLRRESSEFLQAFRRALENGAAENVDGPAWTPTRELLAGIFRSRSCQGFTLLEAMMFVLSLKEPLFEEIHRWLSDYDALEILGSVLWRTTVLLDHLALLATEFYQKGCERMINQPNCDAGPDERDRRLRRADEISARFLSNMTHDLRTPLNSIQALTRLLLDRIDGELTNEQERQVHLIQKSADSLSELVNDLLELGKVAAGKILVRPVHFEVKDLFGELRGMLQPLIPNATVNLVFETPENLSALDTDEAKVSQILRNFVSNGLKFTEHGEVRVSARLSPGGHNMVFSVTDTGIGIAEEDQERIFEEFAQIESPLQRSFKGAGLGLSLAKKLAELLGGSVSVESKLGASSTFTATIPLRLPSSEAVNDRASPPETTLAAG
jgi:signal transduction histidine kinase